MISGKKSSVSETPSVNLIAKNTVIKGDIECKGDFRLEGTLEGKLVCEGKVVIGETGVIKGELICRNADIAGKLQADVTVSDLLHLRTTCHLTGNIATHHLSVDVGAYFSGNCIMSKKTDSHLNKKSLATESAAMAQG